MYHLRITIYLLFACSDSGGLDDIKVKLEPNIEDSPSHTSTFSGSITDHRPSHSKVKSLSPRKARRVHQTIQARKKPDASSRKASSSESTDELEDFEPSTQNHHTKQKQLPVRQGIPSKHARQKSPSRFFRQESPSNIAKVNIPKPRVSDDDTTDDMDEDTKPIKDDDKMFENVNKPNLQSPKLSKKSSPAVSIQYQSQELHGQMVQQTSLAEATPVKKTFKLSLNRHRSSPKSNPVKVLAHSQRISTFSILLQQSEKKLPQRPSVDTSKLSHLPSPKGDSMHVHTPSRRLSTEALSSPTEEAPVFISSSNTLVQPFTTTSHQQHSSYVATSDLSTDELKEFERFSDTETGDDISILKKKRQVKKRLPFSTDADVESGSESQGCYQSSSKKEKSIKKVHKWLDSSNEGSIHAKDIVAQPDSQTDEMMMQTSMMEQLTGNPPTSKVICDTSDQQSNIAEQLEPVSSSQELRATETERSKNIEDNSRSDRDKYTPESTSSSSSSLPPVMWEQEVHPTVVTKPERSLMEDRAVTRVSHNQLQSSLISTSSDKQCSSSSSTSVIDIKRERGHSDIALLEERKLVIIIDEDHNENSSNQLDVKDTLEEAQRVENNLHEQGIKGIAAVSKEIVPDTKKDNEPESMSIGSPMEVDVYQSKELPVTEHDTASEGAVNISEASHDLTVTEQCSHSSSEICHSGVDLVKESNMRKTNEQFPASTSPVHQTTKHIVEGTKSLSRKMPGKTLLTEVPGMNYSSRKAILKRNYLPDPSISIQRPSAETQLSGTASLKQSNVNQAEQLSLNHSLLEQHFRMQTGDASVTIKKSLPASSASSARLSSLVATGKALAKYKGTSSHLSKKIQSSGTSPNTSSPRALSVSTQNLLDSIGQPPSIASVSSGSRPKHLPSFIPAKISKKHVSLKPKILPKVDDFSREVLSWDPAEFLYPQQAEGGKLIEPTIQLKEGLVKVPSTEPFESFDHYLATFKPLILHELWSMVSSYTIVSCVAYFFHTS